MTAASNTSYAHNPRLSAILRGVWLFMAGLTLLLYAAGLPLEYARLLDVGASRYTGAFAQTGVTPAVFAGYRLALDVLQVALFAGVSTVIVVRSRGDWVAQLVALLLLTLISASSFAFYTLGFERGPLWRWPVVALTVGNWLVLMLVFFVFPDGKFTPSWTQPLALPLAVGLAVLSYLVVWEIPDPLIPDTVIFWLVALVLVPAQVYRYRYATSASQRQQTKWVFYGIIASVLWGATASAFDWLISANLQTDPLLRLVYEGFARVIVWLMPLSIFPVCVGIAVTRSRLWDIDLVINRSLVGGAITLLLGAVFFGVFALAQLVFDALVGDGSLLAAGVSAVTVALLYNPVHDRLRSFVDHRIYHFERDLNEVRRAAREPNISNPGEHTGRIIGDYQIADVIGRGGMGEVYRGIDEKRMVAVKTLRHQMTDMTDDELLKRFQREAQALQSLHHPHIVKLYDYGQDDDLHYIAMEHIDGVDLQTHLKDHPQLSLAEVVPIAQAVADALDYAHSRGIIHRDIKPANIMLRAGDHAPVLMDFGIVKIAETMTRLTEGHGVGTVDYMAPEQLVTTIPTTHKADLYAFAGVLYRMLTGHNVFEGNTAQIMFAHLQQPPTHPHKHLPELPNEVAAILVRALAKKPQDRPDTAQEIADALVL